MGFKNTNHEKFQLLDWHISTEWIVNTTQSNVEFITLDEDLRVSAVVIASSLHKASCRSSFANHPLSEKALSTEEVRRLYRLPYIPTPPFLDQIRFGALRASTSCTQRERLVPNFTWAHSPHGRRSRLTSKSMYTMSNVLISLCNFFKKKKNEINLYCMAVKLEPSWPPLPLFPIPSCCMQCMLLLAAWLTKI